MKAIDCHVPISQVTVASIQFMQLFANAPLLFVKAGMQSVSFRVEVPTHTSMRGMR